MRRTSARATLVILLATAVVLGIVPYAQADEQKDCSNATLRGSFGYTITGLSFSAPPPLAGPFGQVGRQTFDGNGNTAATANQPGLVGERRAGIRFATNCACPVVARFRRGESGGSPDEADQTRGALSLMFENVRDFGSDTRQSIRPPAD
jgi:hypothetical protein